MSNLNVSHFYRYASLFIIHVFMQNFYASLLKYSCYLQYIVIFFAFICVTWHYTYDRVYRNEDKYIFILFFYCIHVFHCQNSGKPADYCNFTDD